MRHIVVVSGERPVQAATLLTKAQAISNAMGIVRLGQEGLVLIEQALNLFSKGE